MRYPGCFRNPSSPPLYKGEGLKKHTKYQKNLDFFEFRTSSFEFQEVRELTDVNDSIRPKPIVR
jgi:hypothetical protein